MLVGGRRASSTAGISGPPCPPRRRQETPIRGDPPVSLTAQVLSSASVLGVGSFGPRSADNWSIEWLPRATTTAATTRAAASSPNQAGPPAVLPAVGIDVGG